MLRKIISGGQTGVDIAALRAAKIVGLETGGTAPHGFRTLDGAAPWLGTKFGLVADVSSYYPPRTRANVRDSDGTLQIAEAFDSPGELCTAKAIRELDKPVFRVFKKVVSERTEPQLLMDIADWIETHEISVLNVAGNSEQTAPGIEAWAEVFLEKAFREAMR